MTRVLEATDLDGIRSLLGEEYAAVRLTPRDDRRELRIEQQRLGRVRLDRTSYRMTVDIEGAPLDRFCVGRVRDGRVDIRRGTDDRARYERGDVHLTAEPSAPIRATVDDLTCDYAIIEPGLFDEVAEPDRDGAGSVRLLGFEPVSAGASAQWSRAFGMVHSVTAADPGIMSSPLVAAQSARLLAAVTLATFPNNARVEPTARDRRDGHPHTLRRAIAFIEANPDLDIGLPDVARAAFVTPRALQLAFRRHLDTTPMRYLRRVRLELARADLRGAAPGDGLTVTAVSARWGYARPSRFAADYRAAYAEHPHRTLQRARGEI